MNERIRELAIQAGFFYEDYKDIWYLEYHNESCEEEMKKFAELIVRECMDIAYAYDAPKLSGPGMIVANRIEDHFGVEQ
jgi:hypothetical protein